MYFVASNTEGVMVKNGTGQVMGVFRHEHEDEVRTMVQVINSRPDVATFCEQVVFWHDNFQHEEGTEIQKITSKVLLTLAKGVQEKI